MDLSLLLVLVGLAVVLFTSLNTLGYFLFAVGVIVLVYSAYSGRGTFYRRR